MSPTPDFMFCPAQGVSQDDLEELLGSAKTTHTYSDTHIWQSCLSVLWLLK